MADRAKSSEGKSSTPKTSGTRSAGADRVRKHREKMKALGLKPVTLWVPDVDAPGMKEKIARTVAAINADTEGMRAMEDMLEIADFSDWK